MKEYGEASSWTWIYKIERASVPWSFKYCKPLMFSENDKKVLLEMHQYNHTKLVWYEIEKKKGRGLRFRICPFLLGQQFVVAVCFCLMVII